MSTHQHCHAAHARASPDITGKIDLLQGDGAPQPECIDLWRTLGEEKFRIQLEPLPGFAFHAEWRLRVLPGLNIVWARNSPLRFDLPKHLIAKSSDSVCCQWQVSDGFGIHMGREVTLKRNDAVMFSCCEPGHLALPRGGSLVSLNVPRDALRTLLRGKDPSLGRPLPDSEALHLLMQYVRTLRYEVLAAPELQQLAVTHIYDLLAMAIGATRDATLTAESRGVPAAKLQAIKADIASRLTTGTLSLANLASRHRLTVRKMQRLFEREDLTFTEFVCKQRLFLAHQLLTSPRFADRTVAEIALSCGFGDISYFNRRFREHYCATPSDIRHSREIH